MSSSSNVPQPPQPPEIQRHLQLRPLQLIGVPILALIPILALLGVFSLAQDQTSASSEQLELQVRYPSRSRYKMAQTLDVILRNTSTQTLSGVQVAVSRDYVESFTNVTFTPNVNAITEEAYVVDLGELAPEATREVTIELEPENRGQLEGTVRASATESEPVTVTVSGFVFP